MTYAVTTPGQQVNIDVETDKLYNTCTGINVLISADSAKFSHFQLDINNQEVFPANFEVIRVLFRGTAPFGFDYHRLSEPAAGSKVKGKYTDSGTNTEGRTSEGRTSIYPYNLTISLRLENIEPKDTGNIQ